MPEVGRAHVSSPPNVLPRRARKPPAAVAAPSRGCEPALALRIHDHVVPRLCGVALVLAGEGELAAELRERCEAEVTGALLELRSVLLGALADEERSLDGEARRWRELGAPLRVTRVGAAQLPPAVEALACQVLGEAVANALRHASPSRVDAAFVSSRARFTLTVTSDGASRGATAGLGLGMRLAEAAAARLGGRLAWGPKEEGRWMVRLTVPLSGS